MICESWWYSHTWHHVGQDLTIVDSMVQHQWCRIKTIAQFIPTATAINTFSHSHNSSGVTRPLSHRTTSRRWWKNKASKMKKHIYIYNYIIYIYTYSKLFNQQTILNPLNDSKCVTWDDPYLVWLAMSVDEMKLQKHSWLKQHTQGKLLQATQSLQSMQFHYT